MSPLTIEPLAINIDSEAVRAALTDRVRGEIAAFLSVEPAEIVLHESLYEWGLDSLQAVDLRLRLEQALGCPLDPLQLAADPTPAAVIEMVLHRRGSVAVDVEQTVRKTAPLPPLSAETYARLHATPLPLNRLDRFLAASHNALQAQGDAGLPLQFHLWFRDRIDAAALRAALDALVDRWPVLSSRLDRKWMVWQYSPEAAPVVEIRTTDASREADVLHVTEQVLGEPCDLTVGPLVRGVIVRRPMAGDVLLVQMPHAVIDYQGAEALLGLLTGHLSPPGSMVEQSQLAGDAFNALNVGRRWSQFLRTLRRDFLRRRPPIVRLVNPPQRPARPTSAGRLRFEWLDESTTEALESRTRRFGDQTPQTLLLTAIGLRAVVRCRHPQSARRCLVRLPYSLRLGRDRFVPCKNLAAAGLLYVELEALDAVEDVIRTLAQQFVDQRAAPCRTENYWRVRIAERILRWRPRLVTRQFQQTIHTTALGELVPVGTEAFGSVVERAYATMACLPEMEISVSVWPVGARRLVCFLYQPDVVDAATLERFVAVWREELEGLLNREAAAS